MSDIRQYKDAVDIIKTAILQSQARAANFTNAQDKAMKMIRTRMNRGYVTQNTEYSFQKSDKFRSNK